MEFATITQIVSWGGCVSCDLKSETFDVRVGLKQGCVLSPILFALYIKELGDTLILCGRGVQIGGVTIPGLLFTDDMVLMAESEEDLQYLLDLTGDFVEKRNIPFNSNKSKILNNFRETLTKRCRLGRTENVKEGHMVTVNIAID